MRYKNVCVESIVCALPPEVITSSEIETQLAPLYDRLKLPVGRLEMMSGVSERRLWHKGTRPSDASAIAGTRALEQTKIDVSKIGMLVHSAVCRDFMEPATASVVHSKLNLPRDCMVYDLSNACLGFANAMTMVANAIESGQIEAGLVVCGEVARPLLEGTIHTLLTDETLTRKTIKPMFASLTIGSGAAAAVLTKADIYPDSPRIIGGSVLCASEHHTLCQGGDNDKLSDEGRPLMATDSEELLKAGIALARETGVCALKELGWASEDVKQTFSHQVGGQHRKMMLEAVGISEEKDLLTFKTLGNTGSAALPTAMALGAEKNNLKKDDKVLLLGIGSGLNCMMLGVEW